MQPLRCPCHTVCTVYEPRLCFCSDPFLLVNVKSHCGVALPVRLAVVFIMAISRTTRVLVRLSACLPLRHGRNLASTWMSYPRDAVEGRSSTGHFLCVRQGPRVLGTWLRRFQVRRRHTWALSGHPSFRYDDLAPPDRGPTRRSSWRSCCAAYDTVSSNSVPLQTVVAHGMGSKPYQCTSLVVVCICWLLEKFVECDAVPYPRRAMRRSGEKSPFWHPQSGVMKSIDCLSPPTLRLYKAGDKTR